MTMPAISAAASAAVAGGRAARRAAPRAARPSRRSRPRPDRPSRSPSRASLESVVVDDDPRQRGEQRRVAVADRPDPIERAAVADHEQVVVDRRDRDPVRTRPIRAGSRRAAARGRCRPASRSAPWARRARQTAEGAPSVSASGFSWLTTRTRWAVTMDATTASGTAAATDRGRRPSSLRLRRAVPADRSALARARLARTGRTARAALAARHGPPAIATAGSRIEPARPSADRRRRLGGRRWLIGQITFVAQPDHRRRQRLVVGWPVAVRHAAGLELARAGGGRACRARRSRRAGRGARGSAAAGAAAQLVPDERHRPLERHDRRRRARRLADDADPDPGVAEVRRRLDPGDRGEPDPRVRRPRGSGSPRSPAEAARRPDPCAASS